MMNRYDNAFGGRSVEELAHDIRGRLRRVSSAQPEDIEDAVSVGVLAVLDYWVEKYEDLKDDSNGKRFNYASTFGTRRGREYLQEIAARRQVEISLEAEVDPLRRAQNPNSPTDNDFGDEPWTRSTVTGENIFVDTSPSPEETVLSDEAAARDTWKSLTNGQRKRCAKALTGKGYCNRVAVHRDRKWASSLLRTRALRYGLC